MSDTREELARLMREFEAKNGPVETIPVDFKNRPDTFKDRYRTRMFTIRSEKKKAADKLKQEREAKANSTPLVKPKPTPKPKPKSKKDIIEERLAAVADDLDISVVELRTALDKHMLSVRILNKT